jgi:hypothetical protein
MRQILKITGYYSDKNFIEIPWNNLIIKLMELWKIMEPLLESSSAFQQLASTGFYRVVPCLILGTRFTNAISCFEPGLQ